MTTTFHVTGKAGSVIDTSQAGYVLRADGEYSWDTRAMSDFQVKHLVTYAGDLNYDGRVGFQDIAALDAGARSASSSEGSSSSVDHSVDADFNGVLDIDDLGVIDGDWNHSLHDGDSTFTGSGLISMEELFDQGGRSWNSSSFAYQNAIESGVLHEASKGHERSFIDELVESTTDAMGLDQHVVDLFEEQHQYAETTV